MPKPQRPIYVLRLRPLPRVDGIKALRRGLKFLLRQCGLQCLGSETRKPNGETPMPRTSKQVIAEQQKQADRDRAQKPAQPVPSPSRRCRPPSTTAARASVILTTCAPSGIVGRLVKFDARKASSSSPTTARPSPRPRTSSCWPIRRWSPGSSSTATASRRRASAGCSTEDFVLPPREELGDTDPSRLADRPVGQARRPVEARANGGAAPAGDARTADVLHHDRRPGAVPSATC